MLLKLYLINSVFAELTSEKALLRLKMFYLKLAADASQRNVTVKVEPSIREPKWPINISQKLGKTRKLLT
jgi:hypothetical protein